MSTNVHEIGHGFFHQNVYKTLNELKEEIEYDLAEMEEYLSSTYGITVYQEQVMLHGSVP